MKLPTSLDRRLSLTYAVMVTALALAVFIVSAAAREWAPIAATVVAWALAMGVGLWLLGRITERTMASLRIVTASAERLASGASADAARHDEARRLRDALNRVAERHRVLTAALEAERLRSAALIAGVADGALVVDGANRIMLANAAACALLAIDQASVASGEALLRDHDLQLLTAACRSHTARRA
ncbi:MAG: PAS domain-containing protein, partial [Dehalococcoidia bacterium]|nr:PAS domain-containing protein [Dehalococcoidia bacterium]